MGASRVAGARLLGVVRDVQSQGAAEALHQRLNLTGVAGRPAAEVFVAVMEFVCPPGGTVDEAIARDAMVEAIADLAESGVMTFDALTREQLDEFFLDFVIRSIEGRIIADIGQRSITLPADVVAVQRAEQQLHDFVAGCTRDQLAKRLGDVDRLSDRDLEGVVNGIYEAAFSLLASAGEGAT